MDERLRFVARLLDGEAMTEVCREFGISRKTGYKIFNRYKEHGLEALSDRSRRPVRYANQLPQEIESLIGAVTLQGSYNWTRGAASNSEDLNLISSRAVAGAYSAHWRQRRAVSARFVDREDWCRASSAEMR